MVKVNVSVLMDRICETCPYRNTPACGIPCSELDRRLLRLIQKTYNVSDRFEAFEILDSLLDEALDSLLDEACER